MCPDVNLFGSVIIMELYKYSARSCEVMYNLSILIIYISLLWYFSEINVFGFVFITVLILQTKFGKPDPAASKDITVSIAGNNDENFIFFFNHVSEN